MTTRGFRLRAAQSVLVFALAVLLVWPFFKTEYSDKWSSIESTFISDARMLGDHLPHTGWQPLWYCGTRFDYVYPPALRYGTAWIAKFGGVSTARAYHAYAGFCYAFGLLAVFWLVLAGTGNGLAAGYASAAVALLSPSFLFLKDLRIDAGGIPQRLHVLAAYGEGPHITAVSVLGAALAAAWIALRGRRPRILALAGVLAALVVANNFYGATSMAILFPILVWAVWCADRDAAVFGRAAAIAGIAYGLCATWLTPSYVQITLIDMKWVSEPGNGWSKYVALGALAAMAAAMERLGRGKPERAWTLFVGGAAFFLALDVIGYQYFHFMVSGNSQRLVPEMDLMMLLAWVELLRAGWSNRKWRIAVAVPAILVFGAALPYLQNVWAPFGKSGPLGDQYEYQIAQWAHKTIPGERTLSAGAARFWFDAWHDNAQLDGGSSQGMLNQIIPDAIWNVEKDARPELAVYWLKAMGTDVVIVPGNNSREHYRDYVFPDKFRGVLPVIFDDGHDTVAYRIPRVHPGIGRVVDRKAIDGVGEIRSGEDAERLSRYVAAVENAGQAETPVQWRGFDEVEVRARAGTGQSVLLQESYDPAWHAYEDGRELTIRREPAMGFMLVDVPEGTHALQFRFETPGENQVGRLLLLLALAGIAQLVRRR
jgi:hypothetical protein